MNNRLIRTKNLGERNHGQVFSIDFILGSVIIVLLLVYASALFLTQDPHVRFEESLREAQLASDILLSTGEPEEWNLTNMSRPGLTDGNQAINMTKANMTGNLTDEQLRAMLGATGSLTLEFYEINGTQIDLCPGCTRNITGVYDTHAIVDRYVAYEGRIVMMRVGVWQ